MQSDDNQQLKKMSVTQSMGSYSDDINVLKVKKITHARVISINIYLLLIYKCKHLADNLNKKYEL